jgi:hypothetical protein
MIMPRRNNLLTVAALVNDRKTFKPEVITAAKAYARSKPWQGTIEERQTKLKTFHEALCAAYELTIGIEFVELRAEAVTGGVAVSRDPLQIVLQGKVSVVNYLHAFAKARGVGPRERFSWSINLFKRCFPKSFDRAEKVGPYLLQRGTTTRLQAAQDAAAAEEQNEQQSREIEGWDDSEESASDE